MNLELGFANPIKIIVGLKQDLDAERVVDQTLIAAFAKKFNYKARLETTSTDSANSLKLFDLIAKFLYIKFVDEE
eukprot:CAMPEP_0170465468 /NCGR_PEP_ID=MMETSP0123-20130129/9800_1 /TAXON_ID=182087 /ORGANISM="Favella ehrenbergii, Strain Fehren 1" /LENGTH=74 /DNA_ID=CAMNT_0010731371 /DNA_START=423 /DNA_END=647 /DNA_ORIENTATION=+